MGLKATIEKIDNRGDFKTYMQNYAFARGSAPPRGPRREGPSDEGFVSLTFLFVTSSINPCILLRSYPLYPFSTTKRSHLLIINTQMAQIISMTKVDRLSVLTWQNR